MSGTLPPDFYWGGYTEHGALLHLVVGSQHEHPRSACGLLLTDAWDIPDQMRNAKCRKCVAAEAADERAELEALREVSS